MKKKLAFVGLLVLVVLGSCCFYCLSLWNGVKPFGPHPNFTSANLCQKAIVQNERGTSLLERGEFRTAIRELDNAYKQFDALTKKHPKVREYRVLQISVSYDLANTNQIIGEMDLALDWYEKSVMSSELLVQQQPEVAENHMLLGDTLSEKAKVYAQLGHVGPAKQTFEEARAAWRATLRIDRSIPEASSELGNIAWSLGENDAAMRLFQRAISAAEERLSHDRGDIQTRTRLAGDYHNVAMLMHQSGERDEARKNYEKAIREQEFCYRQAPDTTDCRTFLRNHYHALAGLLAEQNSPGDAAVYYKKAIQLIPHDSQLHAALSDMYFAQQRYVDAIRVGAQALELELNRSSEIEAAIRMTLSQSYAFTGECDKALDVLEVVVSQYPDAPSVLRCSGVVNSTCGRDTAAIESLERYLKHEPSDVDALYRVGISYLRVHQKTDAVAASDALRRLDPERAARLELAIADVEDGSDMGHGATSTLIGPVRSP